MTQEQHLQANLLSRATMGDSVLEMVAAMGAVVDRPPPGSATTGCPLTLDTPQNFLSMKYSIHLT